MFYTSIITSILPYILLLGVFSTLLLNRVAFTNKTSREQVSYASFQKKQDVDASGTFLYSSEQNKFNKEDSENLQTSSLFKKAFEVLLDGKCLYPPSKIPLQANCEINNTYSFRGPPA